MTPPSGTTPGHSIDHSLKSVRTPGAAILPRSLRWHLLLVMLLPLGWIQAGCADVPGDDEQTPTATLEPYTRPDIQASTERLDFGEVLIGTSKTLPLDIINAGDADLYVETVEISAGTVFSVPNAPSGFTILPDTKVTVEVMFSPTEVIETGGSLRITSNDEMRPSMTVSLVGTGTRGTDDDGDDVTIEEGDCDDTDDTVNPNAPEICDAQDNDCDNEIDESSDADGDGYSSCAGSAQDCDDADGDVHPDADEVCDGIDNNCDGAIDEGYDTDDDGSADCIDDDNDGSSEEQGDCNDADGDVGPEEVDICDGIDNDCDGTADNGSDTDGDGTSDCTDDDGDGVTEIDGDCNDADPNQYPGNTEVCNNLDEDCDGIVDDGVDADVDEDGVTVCDGDCKDNDAAVYPGAAEACNGQDDNCNSQIDEGLATVSYYADADGDTYGDPAVSTTSCRAPVGYVTVNTDCDDNTAAVYPGATELCNSIDDDCDAQIDEGLKSSFYVDGDNDGYGSAGSAPTSACSAPTGYVGNSSDCDDTKGSVNPAATETCNGVDDNCNAQIDEGLNPTTWYQDADGDGYGNANVTTSSCAKPSGYVATSSDCDDTKSSVNPAGTETCNAIDDDCDTQIDEGVKTNYYVDGDNDGFGKSGSTPVAACSAPSGHVANSTDCDDTRSTTYPGASEQCNSRDDDCDGQVDEGVTSITWYLDADQDTFGAASPSQVACSQPTGYVSNKLDCDDSKATINPSATETCNGIDDDCDTQIDEGVKSTYTIDGDADGYGKTGGATVTACSLPSGYSTNALDCDDANAAIKPGATEICDGIDQDCDGTIDEGFGSCNDSDDDGDGHTETGGDCNDANSSVYPMTVDVTYSGTEDGSKTRPFNTVQEGINAVNLACPLVQVKPGTYNERIDFKGKPITVKSLTQYAAILDGQALGSVVSFKTAESTTAVLDGFTIQNGKATNGGGVYSLNASPTVKNNLFKLNNSTNGGGALYAKTGTPVITGNRFEDNIGATVASGSFAGGAVMLESAPGILSDNLFLRNRHISGGALGIKTSTGLQVSGNEFESNIASDASGGGVGGAIYLLNTSLDIVENLFYLNSASDAGGAVYIFGQDVQSNTTVDLNGNQFVENTAGNMTSITDDGLGGALFATFAVVNMVEDEIIENGSSQLGGAVYIKNLSTATFTGVSFVGNYLLHTTSSAGGALYVSSSSALVDGCTFDQNMSSYNAGAITALSSNDFDVINSVFTSNRANSSVNGKGAGMYLDRVIGTLIGNSFQSNVAGYSGGAVILQDSAVDVYHNVFTNNSAANRGGAVWITSATGSSNTSNITNNRFEGNSITGGGGGAIYFNSKSTTTNYVTRGTLINNVMVENSATTNGAAVYIGVDSVVTMMNNALQANKLKEAVYVSTGTSDAAKPILQYNDAFSHSGGAYAGKSGVWDSTNLDVDPKFTTYSVDGNFTNDVFTLQVSSAIKNAGNPATQYNDADGSRNDIGAYGGSRSSW